MDLSNIILDISDYGRHHKFTPKVIEFINAGVDFVVLRNNGNKSLFLKRKYFLTIDYGKVTFIEIKSPQHFNNLVSIAMISVVDVVSVDKGVNDKEQKLLLDYFQPKKIIITD